MSEKLTIPEIRRIWHQTAWIDIPVAERVVSFAFPEFNDYPNIVRKRNIELAKQITETGVLRLPTAEDMIYFLDTIYGVNACVHSEEFKRVRDLFENGFYIFNRNFFLHEGVYVCRDINSIEENCNLGIDELEAKLGEAENYHGVRFNPETRVAFAPVETYSSTLAGDGFVLASFGPKVTEKLVTLSKKFGYQSTAWKDEIREINYSTISVLRKMSENPNLLKHSGLIFDGSSIGNSRASAFGVKK